MTAYRVENCASLTSQRDAITDVRATKRASGNNDVSTSSDNELRAIIEKTRRRRTTSSSARAKRTTTDVRHYDVTKDVTKDGRYQFSISKRSLKEEFYKSRRTPFPESSPVYGNDIGGTPEVYDSCGQRLGEFGIAEGCLPPEIAPVSGVLNEHSQLVVRPIAIKPIVTSFPEQLFYVCKCLRLSPSLTLMTSSTSTDSGSSKDEGYTSGNSLQDSSVSSSSDCSTNRNYRAPKSLHPQTVFCDTPSPTDSGLDELLSQLREKDLEVEQLREVMANNEVATVRAYGEKEKMNKKALLEVHSTWERHLKVQKDKALSRERDLLQKLNKLHLECKCNVAMSTRRDSREVEELQEEWENCKGQPIRILEERTRDEMERLRKGVEELEWEQCSLQGEAAMLKEELGNTSTEAELLRNVLTRSGPEIATDSSYLPTSIARNNLDTPYIEEKLSFEEKLNTLRHQLQECSEMFQREREQWLAEKYVVIAYQKQLQLNYSKVYEKNRLLQEAVGKLREGLDWNRLELPVTNLATHLVNYDIDIHGIIV